MSAEVVNITKARQRLRPQGNGAFCRFCVNELKLIRKQVTLTEDDFANVCDRLCVMRIERDEGCPSGRY